MAGSDADAVPPTTVDDPITAEFEPGDLAGCATFEPGDLAGCATVEEPPDCPSAKAIKAG